MSSARKIKTIPALEARTQLGRLMKDVQREGLRVLVEKAGVPMIGIISAEEFRRLVAEREARFAVMDRIRRRVPAVPERQLARDVASALKEVRRRRRA
jgi:prevent-host-death family protein